MNLVFMICHPALVRGTTDNTYLVTGSKYTAGAYTRPLFSST